MVTHSPVSFHDSGEIWTQLSWVLVWHCTHYTILTAIQNKYMHAVRQCVRKEMLIVYVV